MVQLWCANVRLGTGQLARRVLSASASSSCSRSSVSICANLAGVGSAGGRAWVCEGIGRCVPESAFGQKKNRFRFGYKRAGPKTKAEPNGTEEMASLRARSMAGPIPTPAELDEVFRGDHAGTLLAAHERTFLKSAGARASDASQARELSDRCVPPAGARGHAARARRVRRAHRRRGRLRQGARPSKPHARRASRHAQHRPRRSALA